MGVMGVMVHNWVRHVQFQVGTCRRWAPLETGTWSSVWCSWAWATVPMYVGTSMPLHDQSHGNLAFAYDKREKDEPGDLLPSSLLKSEDMK